MMNSEQKEKLKRVFNIYNLHFNEIRATFEKGDIEFSQMVDVRIATEITDKKTSLNNLTSLQHNLNIKKLEQALVSDKNYLDFLYAFSESEQKEFLLILSHTALGKNYYEKYCEKWRDLKLNKMHKAQNNLFGKVIEIVKIDKNLDDNKASENEIIKYLEYLSNTLQNNHYTERQLYENFLFQMISFLKTKSYKDKYSKIRPYTKDKIIQIVNNLIKGYFSKDKIKFSNKINTENFIHKHYIYENMAGIHLTHSS